MHLINAQYRIMDVFEKNPFQSLMLGASVENTDDIVVINEVLWSPLFTPQLVEMLTPALHSLRTHSVDQESCQLVTAYHQGLPVSKYITSRQPGFKTRINLCYEFLQAITAYDPLPAWVQDILIDEDQIIVWEGRLQYNELLVLKTDDAARAGKVPFSRIRRKIARILEGLTGNRPEVTPALAAFLGSLPQADCGLDTLQAVYDGFQKVYLYDYYLNQDDAVRSTVPEAAPDPGTATAAAVGAALVADAMPEPWEADSSPPEEDPDLSAEEPQPDGEESPLPEAPAVPAEEAQPLQEAPGLSAAAPLGLLTEEPPVESDDLDSDMEKNLELFFNRPPRESGSAEEAEDEPEGRGQRTLLLLAGAVLLLLLAFAGFRLLGGSGAPVASFSGTYDSGLWQLVNTSEFHGEAALQRAEWTVYLDGQLIDLYDTPDLSLSVEEAGTYQVVLRVMDTDGKWSQPFKKTLDAAAAAPPPETVPAGQGPADAGERMDQYAWKFDEDRVVKDPSFLRSGTHSLKVSGAKDPTLLEIEGLTIQENGMVSLWMASSDTKAFTVTFTGYHQNTRLFTKKFDVTPLSPLQWEMRQFTLGADQEISRMTLEVSAAGTVYLDDLNIDSYK